MGCYNFRALVCHKGDDPLPMKIDKKICLFTVLMVLTLLVLPIQPAKAQFVLAEWDYPDEYGQGIDGLKFYENSTESWVAAPYYTDIGSYYYLNYYETDFTLNWSAGVGMKLRIFSVLNTTLIGIDDGNFTEGKNYQRHNITVTNIGTIVFSQQNFTYFDYAWVSGDLIFYEYDVVLNLLPQNGQIYIVTVTYEVFY